MSGQWGAREVVTVILAGCLGVAWAVALIVAVFQARRVGTAFETWLAVVGGVLVGYVAGTGIRSRS